MTYNLPIDRFATDHQLKQLQNEFRSGLRELDAVKAELAGSMMGGPRGGSMMGGSGGGNLGASVPGVDRKRKPMGSMAMEGAGGPAAAAMAGSGAAMTGGGNPSASAPPMDASSMGAEYLAAAQQAESSQGNNSLPITMEGAPAILAPRSQSVAAVAEEEWEKRGIGFRSIAERGAMQHQQQQVDNSIMGPNAPPAPTGVGGAVILSNYLRQSLIYDQYERTVREQDDALRSRVDKVRNERSNEKKGGK